MPLRVYAFQSGQRANGGLESLTRILGALRGVSITVVTQAQSVFTTKWREMGLDVQVVDVPRPADRWQAAARVRALLRRLPALAEGQIEARRSLRHAAPVVLFNDQDAVFFAGLGAKLAGSPVVVTLRGTTGIERFRWAIVAQLADVVVTLSWDMRRRFAAALNAHPLARGHRAEIVVIPSIVEVAADAPDRAEARRALGIASDERALAIVGALVPGKRVREVIEALGPRLAPGERLHVFGAFDPAREACAAGCEAARAALPDPTRVVFHGHLEPVHAAYRAADVTLVASDDEGLARCMIESLAHGTPVVSTDVCSAREVLLEDPIGAVGVVVPCGHFRALADAALALTRDPPRRDALGARGVALASERFGVAAVRDAYERLVFALDRA